MSRTVVDAVDLERRVKDMYTQVALDPHGQFHFEVGRAMARRLGYTDAELDAAPAESIESFAGVGYYFDLAALHHGEQVVDLGSGSGMDSFIAAIKVGDGGQVTGIDMTDAQLAKAERLRHEHGFESVRFRRASIDATGSPEQSCDAVISNGVINLSPDKAAVFREAARLLRPGGTSGARRHRHRRAVAGDGYLRRDPLGGLYRGRHAARCVRRRDRTGGVHRHDGEGQSRISLPVEERTERHAPVRRTQRVIARHQELTDREPRQSGFRGGPS